MYKLFKERCRLEVRKNSICNRVCTILNSLPESVVLAESVLKFEKELDRHWKDQDEVYNFREPIKKSQGW